MQYSCILAILIVGLTKILSVSVYYKAYLKYSAF